MFGILQSIVYFFQRWKNTNIEPFELVPFCPDNAADSDTETVVCQDINCLSNIDYLTD